MNDYGFYFSVKRTGVWLMINGRMLSFFKGCNSGKWQFSVWDNVWRKTRTKAPPPTTMQW